MANGWRGKKIRLQRIYRVFRNTEGSIEKVGEWFDRDEAVRAIPNQYDPSYWIEDDFIRIW